MGGLRLFITRLGQELGKVPKVEGEDREKVIADCIALAERIEQRLADLNKAEQDNP